MGLFGKKKSSDTDNSATSVTLEDGKTIHLASTVDCIGDSCPRPQLMTKSTLGTISGGDTIGILVDNPTSMEALPAVIIECGGEHIATVRKDRHWQIVARKL